MSKLPHALLAGYAVLFFVCGFAPYDRATWWAENIPIVLVVAVLGATYRLFRFSDTSYVMMAVLVYMHTIGGHYTFERVPFGFVTELFGFERNHYDRVAHFSVGLYAYPMAELLFRKKLVRANWVVLGFPIATILSVAAGYEIIEWIYAAMEGGSSGAAFLGSQGDVWDAQRDMLADGIGSAVAVAFFWWRYRPWLPDGEC